MAKLVFGMMQSLDGYVDGVAGGPQLPMPGAALHRHFNDQVRGVAGCLYGRRIYEIMRYWDEDRPEWDADRTRLRGGVAGAAEMGCIALIEVGRGERHACWGQPRSFRAQAEGGSRWRDRRRRT